MCIVGGHILEDKPKEEMKAMAKYFKVVEIDEKEFESETMEELEGNELVVSVGCDVYVAVNEEQEDEFSIPLDCFE
jgi:hypothetical protein